VPGVLPFAKMIGGAIALVELKSILENVGAVTGLDTKKLVEVLSKNDSKEP
jgi:hypothetical protein